MVHLSRGFGGVGPSEYDIGDGRLGILGNGERLFFIAGGLCLKPVTGHLLVKMVRWSNAASMLKPGNSNVLSTRRREEVLPRTEPN